MLKAIVGLLGNKKKRDERKLRPIVGEINEVFVELEKLSDEELQNKTSEFRQLLKVVPKSSRVGEEVIIHERAENILVTHPDIEKAVFLGTRRDALPGELVVWVKAREGAEINEDLVTQIKGGMKRLGQGYSPGLVYFTDDFPTTEDEKGHVIVDRHKLMLANAQVENADFREVTWKDIEGTIKDEDESFDLYDLLPDAFAVMKETCRRHIGKNWTAAGAKIEWNAVPFDVQLMGGLSLAQGNIAEMGTGEGKTLTAILPLYLHALMGRGSHLVTVNDYLARRDSEWNTPLFEFLGLTVGCLDKTQPHTPERRAMYLADVTYGTVNEFGFDYLRDNMAQARQQLCQRDLFFAIIDEVDSVLIDEARTPLIISGAVDRSTDQYEKIIPKVSELVNKQNMLVSRFAKEAEDLLAKDDDDLLFEAGTKLFQCYKGSPKHKRYMKLRQEPSYQRLQEKVELELMASKKLGGMNKLKPVEEELYFLVDERNRTIELTERGRLLMSPDNPDYFVIDDLVDKFAQIEQNEELTDEQKEEAKREGRRAHDSKAEELHTINQLLHAFILKVRDVDYVVEEGKVVIVDENTGRKMPGRRWSDGLHQAVEAREGVKIEAETQTLATITIQNFFRMYKRLSGMTGTAETEAAEFDSTYKMDVICIPSNRPLQRKDLNDVVFRTKREKYNAVMDEIERLHRMQLPILVGTTNVADSERLSKLLNQRKLPHQVLNAKNNEGEAAIVAQAGQPGSITISTNMAGRGTDIKLGPGVDQPHKDPESGEEWPGGLQVIGTERHEARRIDNQLRGRSGRQGDPGASRFFVSLEDNLMLWFGSERISAWLERLGMEDGEAIENRLVTNSISKAQKKVEMINQERRQRTLKFDDVLNKQRTQVYTLRREILVEDDLRAAMLGLFEDAIEAEFTMEHGDKDNMGDSDITGFLTWVESTIETESFEEMKQQSWADYEELHDAVMEKVARAFDDKMDAVGDNGTYLCRAIGLRNIDSQWQDHLLAIDDLRESVFLRSYGQKDPLVEFTRDSTALFEDFMQGVNKNIFQVFFRARLISEEEARQQQRVRAAVAQKAQVGSLAEQTERAAQAQAQAQAEAQKPARPKTGLTPYKRDIPKVGRNEPCPCGSGEKYKDCHGRPDMRERVQHTVQDKEEGEPQPRP
ncbi:MAG: preprotein translocase subunit SecA [Candidatus Sumerlaeia bacterium]|nr:preprotein translocase subunit SecA [Candidatus Sumerlaeia bacterium]